jgi:hypothetical protein
MIGGRSDPEIETKGSVPDSLPKSHLMVAQCSRSGASRGGCQYLKCWAVALMAW